MLVDVTAYQQEQARCVIDTDGNGRITEFWTSATDPQAALDFWA